jgi:hypothetical protein
MKIALLVIAILIAGMGDSFAKYQVPHETQAEITRLCDAEFGLDSAKETCVTKEVKAIKWLRRYDQTYGNDPARQEIVEWCRERTADEASYERSFRLRRCINRRNNTTF